MSGSIQLLVVLMMMLVSLLFLHFPLVSASSARVSRQPLDIMRVLNISFHEGPAFFHAFIRVLLRLFHAVEPFPDARDDRFGNVLHEVVGTP